MFYIIFSLNYRMNCYKLWENMVRSLCYDVSECEYILVNKLLFHGLSYVGLNYIFYIYHYNY